MAEQAAVASGSSQRGRSPEVLVIGAGMSGLLMGIELKKAGIDSFQILEKADRPGGTWRENTYPGLTCDVPSHYYTYSFEPNPDWTHRFPPGEEIYRYFEKIPAKYRLTDHIRYNAEVTDARYDAGRWQVTTADGQRLTADVLVAATGVLHKPRYPAFEGLDSFTGACFHSARWDHSVPLEGKRIGIVGNGSTGVQMTKPLADQARHLTVFQRTPQWIMPMANRRSSPVGRALGRRFPLYTRALYHFYSFVVKHTLTPAVIKAGWQRSFVERGVRKYLESVRDAELRRKLTPDYQPMCKRLIVNADFYETLQQPHVELVTDAIERVEPGGVVAADGTLHELDVLVLATGFDAHAFMRPMQMVGENGVTLADVWKDGPRAYRTIAMPHFPNFFMLMGPHSPIGNFSLIAIAEVQAAYVMQWIELLRNGELHHAAPTPEATARFNDELNGAFGGTAWVGGCNSWYLDAAGVPNLWPWSGERYRADLAAPNLAEFQVG